MSRALFVGSLVAWLVLRIVLGLLPGYVADLDQVKSWALSTAIHGPLTAYDKSSYDYPPLFLFLVHPLGEFYLARHPEIATAKVRRGDGDVLVFRAEDGTIYRHPAPPRRTPGLAARFEPLPDDRWLGLLLKIPGLLCDLAIAGMLYVLVAVRGTWGDSRSGLRWGRIAAAGWLWNPAVLWASGYWGTSDSIHSSLALGACAVLGSTAPRREGGLPGVNAERLRTGGGRHAQLRMVAAGALLAAGVLMKPLAAPLIPLLVWVAWARRGMRGFVAVASGGAGVGLLLFLPFFVQGNGPDVLSRVIGDIEAMPYTSINAHNLWWLLGGWTDASESQLLGLSGRTIGLVLFLSAFAVLLSKNRVWFGGDLRGSVFEARLLTVAGSMAGTFFLLSTHMHENHLFTVIPFLMAIAGRGRSFVCLTAVLSCVLLGNLVLHDPSLGMSTLGAASWRSAQGIASLVNAAVAALSIGWLFRAALRMDRTIPVPDSLAVSE